MLPFEETFSPERANVITDLLCSLGFNRIVKFDMLEPEFHALKTLHESGVEPKYLGLIAVCTGVIDFQLGFGGADRLWKTLVEIAGKFEDLNDLRQVELLMVSLLTEPVNRRSLQVKAARMRRIFDSGFAEWFIKEYDGLRQNPIVLWRRLSETLRSRMERKTMVFAMKAFDISHLICFGDYASFPWDIPIPVDFHIRNVTVSSGLLKRYESDDSFRKAWIYVLKELKEKTGRNISLLRIDSVVWQLGKIMYAAKYERKASIEKIRRYMIEKIGVNTELANRFAEELTLNIDKIAATNVAQPFNFSFQ